MVSLMRRRNGMTLIRSVKMSANEMMNAFVFFLFGLAMADMISVRREYRRALKAASGK